MEINNDNFIWALDLYDQLSGKRNFPQKEAALKAEIRAFLRIVGDQGGNSYEKYDEVQLKPVVVTVPVTPARVTGEWLIEQAVDRFQDFPSAIQLRRVYEEKYSPADGRRSGEMSV